MKFLRVLCVVALVFAVSAVAYAETQSVKVSGDITMRAFARDNYNLYQDEDTDNTPISNSWETYLQSTAEVQVDADLTDNVSGVVRLVNQRVWGDEQYGNTSDATVGGLATRDSNNIEHAYFANGTQMGAWNDDLQNSYAVNIDLAYIELKEFLYSPLTLRIGRQDLWFGKGFIIGANMQVPAQSIYAQEYTAFRSFDAVRATLDYDPWTIDLVYSKITENEARADDDVDLWGVNIGYVFDSFNADAEAYWFWKRRRNPGGDNSDAGSKIINATGEGILHNDVHTFGARTSFDPLETITISAEGAYQTGQYIGIADQVFRRVRSAWAVDAALECRHFAEMFPWKPTAAIEYIFYSGEKHEMDELAVTTIDQKYTGWDKMFRGKFDTAIREYQEWYYALCRENAGGEGTPAYTNQHQLLVRGSIEPTDSLTLEALYAHFWLDKDPMSLQTKKSLGDELDLTVTYDYTEDVSFNILAAWFFPGKFFISPRNDCAADVVGTVKLSF